MIQINLQGLSLGVKYFSFHNAKIAKLMDNSIRDRILVS
jgi:hypothetical protein